MPMPVFLYIYRIYVYIYIHMSMCTCEHTQISSCINIHKHYNVLYCECALLCMLCIEVRMMYICR